MRIIILTSSHNRSGGTRQAMYQAAGLAERGHEVVFCLPHDSLLWELAPPQMPDNLRWVGLPPEVSRWRAKVENLLPTSDVPAIIHAFHNRAVKHLAWWGLFWRRRRLACVAHRGVIFRPGNPLPYLSPAMKAFIVNSCACAGMLRWHCPSRKIHVVPNGIPDSRITPSIPASRILTELDIPRDVLIFGYVGNNNPAKGMDTLLAAFAKAELRQVHLLVLGASPERWQPVCEKAGIADRVHLLGRTEQVSDYLQICDAFVFPSRDMDSAPNTLLEAIRMGLPIVAARVGGVSEIAMDNGVLVPPADVGALAEALKIMADNPEKRAIWAENSRLRGAAFSVAARCAALEHIYLSLLEEKDPL